MLEWEVSFIPNRSRESSRPRVALCIVSLFQTLAPRSFGLSFHTNLLLCTASFASPVGVVGNLCLYRSLTARFSKSPQFHNLVLENSPTSQLFLHELHHQHFHFSRLIYGFYYLFSLSPIPFPPPSRLPSLLNLFILSNPAANRLHTQESRDASLFSTYTQT